MTLPKPSLWQLLVLAGCAICGVTVPASAQTFTVTPQAIGFSKTAVGIISHGRSVTITNTGTSELTITSFSISLPQFLLEDGWAPVTLNPGDQEIYQLDFAPTSAETYKGNLTLTISGVTDPVVIPITGAGVATTAAAQVTPGSLTFGPAAQGTKTAAQTVTVKNIGTSNLMVTAASVLPPFSVTGFPGPTSLAPGQSMNVQITYFATQAGTFHRTLLFSHDVVNSSGAALTGTATAPSALAVTSYPILPAATHASAYQAVLSSAGGTGSTSWSLKQGSHLPTGLTLSNTGLINGTLGPNVATGNYSFAVTAKDAAQHIDSSTLTIRVNPETGAKCSNIFSDIAGTSSPLVAIPDLGTGTYLGSQGGLYPGGLNTVPAVHEQDGAFFGNSIQPLDANGNPDPVNGKYVLLSIGMSAAHTLFVGLQNYVVADPTVDHTHLVLVNGAQDNATAGSYALPKHPVWTDILDYFLPQSHVTANQVVAAWVNDVSYPNGSFPADMQPLQASLENITRILKRKFPNIKLAYYTPRMYGGYSHNPSNPESPEPFAYESGYAIKWAIQDQLNGLDVLNYTPRNGPVQAPWMAWGPYMWANGLIADEDGTVWTCQDYISDGIHPSIPPQIGRDKGSAMLLEFFKTDETTSPWFLAH